VNDGLIDRLIDQSITINHDQSINHDQAPIQSSNQSIKGIRSIDRSNTID